MHLSCIVGTRIPRLMKILHLVISMSTLAAAIACGGSGTSYGSGPTGGGGTVVSCTPGSGTVCIVTSSASPGYAFNPTPMTVAAGSIVPWTNTTTGVQHNITFSTAGSPASSQDFSSGSYA